MSMENRLAALASASEDTEFYTPLPPGYRHGQTKFVIVFGTVMSGLGKGIFSSSLAKVMQDAGLTVAPIKLEGYLNLDSGTLNPYRHGEVFVLDDGIECDMDLGTYERMLDLDLTRRNFSTSGQIFTRVLEKERQGSYLGRDVQMIPHVTGEVKSRLRELAVHSSADVVFVEIGGTVGDVENAYYIEAVRELAFEEGPGNVVFVALTLILEPPSLGEQKSKAAQLGIKRLMGSGVQPHILACRASQPVSDKVRQKLSLYTNVPLHNVFSMHDCESVYLIPEMLIAAGVDSAVVKILGLEERVDLARQRVAAGRWADYVQRLSQATAVIRVGITGKYTSLRDSYASIIQALEHAGTHNGVRVNIEWIDTAELDAGSAADAMQHLDGIIVPGGFGTRGFEGKITCIRWAREQRLPYLGLCYGFQTAVIEYARNVLGLAGANSTEVDPETPHPVIDILPEQKQIEGLGGSMRLGGRDVLISPGTSVARLFNHAPETHMRFRHRYEVDPRYIATLEAGGLIFSGRAPDHPIMQILELPVDQHPFFVGTQAHPEFLSRPLRPEPMFMGFVRAAVEHHQRRTAATAPR